MVVRCILARALDSLEVLEIQVPNRELLFSPVMDPSDKDEVTILVCLNYDRCLRES
jgi:hypothetical protein